MAPRGPGRPLRGRRVLVVEDDWFAAEDLRQELERHGAEVLGPVPSVAAAQDLLVRGALPSAALLDVRLGDEKVYPLADLLRSLEVPVVFATSCARRELPGAYAEAALCRKPIEPRELVRALDGASAGRSGPHGAAPPPQRGG